jgi:hypothetical protein
MNRLIPPRVRYHGLEHTTPTDHISADEQTGERQSSSLDEPSVATHDHPTSERSRSQVNEKLRESDGNSKKLRPDTGWRPIALRRRSIAAFVLVFCLMLAALEILNQYSVRHQGLVSTVQGRHYLWTYGPTASELKRALMSSLS